MESWRIGAKLWSLKKPGGMILIIWLETMDGAEGDEGEWMYIHITDQSFFPFNKIRFIRLGKPNHIPNKRHEVVSFPIFTTTFSTSKFPVYGDDSLAL